MEISFLPIIDLSIIIKILDLPPKGIFMYMHKQTGIRQSNCDEVRVWKNFYMYILDINQGAYL